MLRDNIHQYKNRMHCKLREANYYILKGQQKFAQSLQLWLQIFTIKAMRLYSRLAKNRPSHARPGTEITVWAQRQTEATREERKACCKISFPCFWMSCAHPSPLSHHSLPPASRLQTYPSLPSYANPALSTVASEEKQT